MKIKQTLIFTILIIIIFSCSRNKPEKSVANKIIEVEYPETYELANIILALTKYGKTDKWEVRQNFDYYNKVQEYFEPVSGHPLLDSVNYSRERWEEYLSFRTDAYAFEFDEKNQLKRKVSFYTNKGFHPFDDHLHLINDFIAKSKFRDFFKQNKNYYNAVVDKYKKTQYLSEMHEFLINEFGEHCSDKKYKVVLSPFVYRMNCHRNIDSVTVADFITVPDYVLSDTISINKKKIATSIHNLFTEMDHGYVNPTTHKYKELVLQKFSPSLWDNKSGYNKNDEFGVFNEYMTWAVYDIFLNKYFPTCSDEVGLNWSFQNNSRGFLYSQLFTQKILNIYDKKEKGETLKDLYPKILEWTYQVQQGLSKPRIVSPKDSIVTSLSKKTKITVLFSEPMKKSDTITVILKKGRSRENIDLNCKENNLNWMEDGEAVEFEIDFPDKNETYDLQFNWWGTQYPLISKKGILLQSASYFKVVNE